MQDEEIAAGVVSHWWMPAAGATLVADVGALVVAATAGNARLVTLASAVLVTLAAALALFLNRSFLAHTRSGWEAVRSTALVTNARLLGFAYLWGALAMQGLYTTPLTGLKWQHGWQYGAAMLLLALLSLSFAWKLEAGSPVTRRRLAALAVPLALLQGLGAAFGLSVLAMTGKLFSGRADWAANQVFLFGALAVMILTAITLRTERAGLRCTNP